MFEVALDFRELGPGTLAATGDGWQCAGGQIRGLLHPLLEHRVYEHGDQRIAVARERVKGRAALPAGSQLSGTALDALELELRSWELDWALIVLDVAKRTLRLEVGALGSAPLYAGVHAGRLVISSQLERHAPYLRLRDVQRGYLAHFLVGTAPYGPQTAFESVQLVTERAQLHADRGGVRLTLPEGAPYYRPARLRTDARVADAYLELLRSVLGLWPLAALPVLAELSGGLDSAVVASIVARELPRAPRTYALAVEGAAQAQQLERRRLVVERLGTPDLAWDTRGTLAIPAGIDAPSDYRPGLYNADYQLPLRQAFAALGNLAGGALTTGTGGDELFLPHFFELDAQALRARLDLSLLPQRLPPVFRPGVPKLLRQVLAELPALPFPLVPQSSLQALAARAPLFLEQGLWSVNPLCHPRLVRFCRALPAGFREHKQLQRQALLGLGLPAAFLLQPRRENFLPLLWRSFEAVREQVTHESNELLLGELDLVSPKAFQRLLRSLHAPEHDSEGDVRSLSAFFNIFNLERLLRDFFGRSASDTSLSHGGIARVGSPRQLQL